MLTSAIVRIIGLCTRRPWWVVGVFLVIAIGAIAYSATHFSINSNINALLSDKLDWRQRELAIEKAFNRFQRIIVVVDAPTPELAGMATDALAAALALDKQHFTAVNRAGGGDFFQRNGLLFLPTDQLRTNLEQLKRGEPIIADLATDPSLRGMVSALQDSLLGLQSGDLKLDDFTRTFSMASDTIEAVLAGKPASFSWRVLSQGHNADPSQLRGFIDVRPVLNYGAVEAGAGATVAIRQTAAEVLPQYQATIRLTGPVAVADEEFATIKEGAVTNGLITVAIVIFILWLALHSSKLILAVFINLFVGLAITAATGILMVGTLNLISVYFAVLFVGIGVDFGIQYSVRYRAERHLLDNLPEAIVQAGKHVGAPLTLAAAATAAGFLSFLPTDYQGVSELGLIAGVGMVIAFLTTITLLPAIIRLFSPPGEPAELGFTWLAPLDDFMERRRIPIIVITALVVIAGLPLLYWLRFDFNPINLRNPQSESIATYFDLAKDPNSSTDAVEVLAPSLSEAAAIAGRVAKVAEVGRVVTLASFVPVDQEAKLPIIADAAKTFATGFDPANAFEPPTDADNVQALKDGAADIVAAAGTSTGPGADAAKRLAANMTALADGTADLRGKAEAAFIPPLKLTLGDLQASLQAQTVTEQSLPPDLVREWVAPDGRARVEIVPKERTGDNEAMRQFARAVLAVEPAATQGPISILEAGNTIVRAFIEAGIWALVSISIILWIVLRRVGDVLMTIIPLALAGVVTLELTVLLDLPLNFANIIALPLLLGVGVAFKIYYIMAWREGQTNLLQTSLTRAVFYSALTTATAFGSLLFSSHPGTSSMGELLALSLICTLFAAVLFQPLLMGKPREAKATSAH
jgi:hopanoid biosynthesis associated RND transporter like protein HpnN